MLPSSRENWVEPSTPAARSEPSTGGRPITLGEEELLKYAKGAFPEASVSLAERDRYDTEVVDPVLIFVLESGKERALGLTRELWDHRVTRDLPAWLEQHKSREKVLGAPTRKVMLGETGWIEDADWHLK